MGAGQLITRLPLLLSYLVLQELEPDCPDVCLGPDLLEPPGHGLQLLLGDGGDQVGVPDGVGELVLDRVEVPEEGLVVLDLLVEDGGRLLVEVGGHIVGVDQGLALVQPLPDLSELARQGGVQKPLPVAELKEDEKEE